MGYPSMERAGAVGDDYAAKEARESRVIEGLTDRVRKIETGLVHAIGQATDLKARLLGEREPAQLGKAVDPRVPTQVSCDTAELRKAIESVEAFVETLHGHLNSLGRL